jgi:hypothetical protein
MLEFSLVFLSLSLLFFFFKRNCIILNTICKC